MTRGGANVILYSALLLAIVLHNCKPNGVDYDDYDNAGADLKFSFNRQLRLELYYSPLDTNMITFFQNQLIPVIKSNLGRRIDVKLIPFAGCMLERNETTGKMNVTCPDSPNATNAGLEQFCSFQIMTAKTDKSFVDRNSRSLTFLNVLQILTCVVHVATTIATIASTRCNDLRNKTQPSIERCVSLQDAGPVEWAFERMKQVGVRTFPSIVTTYEQHDKAQDAEAQQSLWNVVCRRLGKSAPEECRNVTGRTANESAVVDTTTTTTKVSTTTAKSKGIGGLVRHTLLPCLLIMSASAFL